MPKGDPMTYVLKVNLCGSSCSTIATYRFTKDSKYDDIVFVISKSLSIPLFQRGTCFPPSLNINSPLIPSLPKRGSRKAGELQRGVRRDL